MACFQRESGGLPPTRIAAEPAGLDALAASSDRTVKARLKEVVANLDWPGKTGHVELPAARPLTPDETARVDRGRALFTTNCASCHQTDGRGQRGRAPPLVASTWVISTQQAAARIVLGGLKGPITVHDREWTMEMPSLGYLDDEQLAAILTYVRRSWGNTADPVDAAAVAEVRKEVASRKAPWSAKELDALR